MAYNSQYTGSQIEDKLASIDNKVDSEDLSVKIHAVTLDHYASKGDIPTTAQVGRVYINRRNLMRLKEVNWGGKTTIIYDLNKFFGTHLDNDYIPTIYFNRTSISHHSGGATSGPIYTANERDGIQIGTFEYNSQTQRLTINYIWLNETQDRGGVQLSITLPSYYNGAQCLTMGINGIIKRVDAVHPLPPIPDVTRAEADDITDRLLKGDNWVINNYSILVRKRKRHRLLWRPIGDQRNLRIIRIAKIVQGRIGNYTTWTMAARKNKYQAVTEYKFIKKLS